MTVALMTFESYSARVYKPFLSPQSLPYYFSSSSTDLKSRHSKSSCRAKIRAVAKHTRACTTTQTTHTPYSSVIGKNWRQMYLPSGKRSGYTSWKQDTTYIWYWLENLVRVLLYMEVCSRIATIDYNSNIRQECGNQQQKCHFCWRTWLCFQLLH